MSLVRLLQQNGIRGCFHELAPDLFREGLDYYHRRIDAQTLAAKLRSTRAGVFFEANNRLFSLAHPIRLAFPNAKFVFLCRNGRQVVRSGLQRKWYQPEDPFRTLRFGADTGATPFVKICRYWTEVNRRILEDLQTLQSDYMLLRFEDLAGRGAIGQLEHFLQVPLTKTESMPQTNHTVSWSVPAYEDWSGPWQRQFDAICGPIMERLGYFAASGGGEPTGRETIDANPQANAPRSPSR